MIGFGRNFRILGSRSRSYQKHLAVVATLLTAFITTILAPTITFAAGENLRWIKRARLMGDPTAARTIAEAIKAARANGQTSVSLTLPRRAAETKAAAPSLLAAPPAPGQWVAAGNMSVERDGHTATRLPDGRVLAAGGFDDAGNWLNTADVYSPTTNSWTPVGALSFARAFHTATLLMDGRVLVVGGFDDNDNSLQSAEIFDPLTNTWTNANSLATARDLHSATLLPDGRVLITGGETRSNNGSDVLVLNSTEIYTPGSNSWAPSGNLAAARYGHTATLLQNGFVLVAGGDTFLQGPPFTENSLASAERFNPALGTWSSAFNMSTPRIAHTATLLPNGKVLVVGGDNFVRTATTITFTPLASVDLYDPGTNSWSPAAPLPVTREDHTATLLADGRVLVAAGEYYNPTPTVTDITLQTSVVYTPQTNSWANDANLITSRNEHTATLLGDNTRVLAAGGASFDCSGIVDENNPCAFNEVLASAEKFHAPITLIYNSPLRDKVQQIVQSPTPGGGLDPTFTLIYPASAPAKTITSLRFDSTLGGIWDTTNATFFWTLGAADGLDSPLFNNPTTAQVNFPIAPGQAISLFASEWTLGAPFTSGLFQPGQEFILTIGFSDATTANASVVIPAVVPPTVTVTAPAPNASEAGPTNGTFRLARTGPTAAPLKVNYTVTGTATNGVDYTALPGSAVIPAGFSTVDVIVAPAVDGLVEGTETVILTVAADPNYTLGAPMSATVNIADNAPALPVVTVVATAPNAAEGGANGLYTVTRTCSPSPACLASPLTVNFALSGSAVSPGNPGADYNLAPSATSVTIPATFATADITLTAVDDLLAEAPIESAVLTITANPGVYTVGSPGSATINIADNEPTVTVAATLASAAEGGASGQFTISRTNFTGAPPLTVNFTLTGTAANGTDYTLISPQQVIIPANTASETVTIAPIDDPTAEPNETVILTISADPAYNVGVPASATVTITDNDPVLTVTATVPNASETGPTNGTFRISRNNTSGNPLTNGALTANFTMSGTAANGTDYGLLGPTAIIPNGSSFVDVNLTPVDDPTPEPTETAILTIGAGSYAIGSPASATVNILDNDVGVLTLTYSGVQLDRVGQNNLAQTADGHPDPAFTVNIPPSGGARTIVSLRLDSSNLGGIWDTIGTGGNFFWTLGAASTFAGALFNAPNDSVSIPVPASGTNFAIFASDWFLGAPFPLGLFLPGQTFTLKITYSDNSMETASTTIPALPIVTVTAQQPNAAEGGANGVFRVSVSPTSGSPLTVNFALSGTAIAPGNPNADYSLVSLLTPTSVQIPAGQPFVDITLTPVDDVTPEATETATLTVGAGAGYVVGAPSSATVNIADNEPTVTVAAQVGSAAEGGANGVFRVSRTPVSASALTVNFTLGGTATTPGNPNADYSLSPLLTPTSVQIPSGQAFVDVTLTAVDDALVEPSETATMTIAADPAYTVGSPSSANINIADNEPTVTVTAQTPNSAEAGANGVYRISRTPVAGTPLTVNFTLSGTAITPGNPNADYSLAPLLTPTSAQILGGQTFVDVTLTPVDDSLSEPTETATLTISASPSYTVGSPSSATVNIADNDLPTLTFAGIQTDQVGQNNLTRADGTADPAFTVVIPGTGSARTITALRLDSTLGGIWDTQGGTFFWTLGAANTFAGPLLNAGNDSVSIAVPGTGITFVVFASNWTLGPPFPAGLFQPGQGFTLTITYSDASTQTVSTTIP